MNTFMNGLDPFGFNTFAEEFMLDDYQMAQPNQILSVEDEGKKTRWEFIHKNRQIFAVGQPH